MTSNYSKLNLGCGRDTLNGWINLDCVKIEGVDVIADLDDCANTPLPFADNSIGEFLASHLIEHIRNPLPLMQELHRIAKHDAKAVFRCPYGSSDDAFEDPTHVRQYFINSFLYFSQPCYWRADYGYRGDWQPEHLELVLDGKLYREKTRQQIFEDIYSRRNVVIEMIVEIKAIKPIRQPLKALQVHPRIDITWQ